MADWKDVGNYAELALYAASLAVWLRILIKRIKWRPPLSLAEKPPISWYDDLEFAAFRDTLLPLVERHPVSWAVPPVCATFLVVFFLPSFLMELLEWLAGPLARLSLAAVQWRCAFSLAQIMTIVGLLRIAGPLQKEDFGCDLSGWRKDVLVGAGGFLASIAPVYLVAALLQHLEVRGPDDKHEFFKILESNDANGILFWIFVSVVVLAPLAEELLYRVLLQGSIQSQIKPWKAIVFCALIFCLCHNPTDVLPLVPLALILGYIYYRQRSYLALVVVHALFNAMNITLALMRS